MPAAIEMSRVVVPWKPFVANASTAARASRVRASTAGLDGLMASMVSKRLLSTQGRRS
jgi:hypothetical protein